MKQLTSRLLYNYWNDIRGHRMAPTRFEIEPARIAPILSETFILESDAGSDLSVPPRRHPHLRAFRA